MAMSPELEQTILAQDIHGFDEIEAGHYVLVGCNCELHTDNKTLSRVDRVTKAQIVIDGDKFHRSNGHALGNGWHRHTITIINAELLMKMKMSEAKQALLSIARQVETHANITAWGKRNDQESLDRLNQAYNQLSAVLATLGGGK